MSGDNVRYFRGTLLLLVFGAPCVLAGIVAALTLIETFLAGWLPATWFSDSPVDYHYGGSKGDAGRWFKAMISTVVCAVCANIIKWGYTGRNLGS